MSGRFRFSDYGGCAASAVWAVGWAGSAIVAGGRAARVPDAASICGTTAAIIFALVGVWMTLVQFRGQPAMKGTKETRESMARRIVGYFAALVWGGAAIIWNLGITGLTVQMAGEGRGWMMLFLLPWSLVGWFLLLVLFAGIGAFLDWAIDLAVGYDIREPGLLQKAKPEVVVEHLAKAETVVLHQATRPDVEKRPTGFREDRKWYGRIGATLFAIAWVNFTVFWIVGVCLGGDAVNARAENGRYYLSSHGRRTEVSRAVWLYSRTHAISVFITHPVGLFVGGGLMIYAGRKKKPS